MFRNAMMAVLVTVGVVVPLTVRASCASPANAIEAENCLAGAPQSTWDIPSHDAGDPTIQGYATAISVNQGDTISFKINTTATAYTISIYRMGYYQGNGARLVATVNPSAALPQTQPACLTDGATLLIDCGNWAVSASWTVPSNAVSGIYFAKLVRSDTGGSSHIVFVVRNDSSHSQVLFQASDTTWQAYNDYGGENFYSCGVSPPTSWNSNCRAYKLSYNRPFHTRVFEIESWVFNSEYPMVRWLEANAYDVSYFTDTDSDRNGNLILNHKVWISNGHDEYWSGNQRANVEAARAAGVNLAFLSGNSVYWKTRWENAIDGSGTPYRTLVCYKETWANAVIDPQDPPTWTGTWRDPRFSPPADGGRPENALAGTITRYAGGGFSPISISVSQADGQMRFWRNTSVATLASGETATLALNTIGDEVDDDEDNGFRPPGLFHVSTTPLTTSSACLLDYGSTTGSCDIVHAVTLYRHPSGALVLSTGTYHWVWGLDVNHDPSSNGIGFATSPDIRMQQATVNFLADMGAQPGALQAGLVSASASTDLTPPASSITSPSPGSSFAVGTTVTISGTALDSGGGVVAGVEVSTDGGVTWHPATGRGTFTYSWTTGPAGTATLESRAVDDSGNLETPSARVSVVVGVALSSIAVTPAGATAKVGGTEQYAATATYSDGSTQDVTPSVAWASSSPSVATIDGNGLLTVLGVGSTTVSATLGSVVGQTALTALPGGLTISAVTLPEGIVNLSYSASLSAIGGVPPYSWAILGALAPGLALDATSGVISGSPQSAGSYSFSVRVTDAASGSSTEPLTLTVQAQGDTIWPSSAAPALADAGADNPVELGVVFRSDVPGSVLGVRFYKSAANVGPHVGNLWSSSGTLLASADFTEETASGWQQASFSVPVDIAANTPYVASYHVTVGHYSDDQNYFANSGVDTPPLHALASGASGPNGVFSYGSASSFPDQGLSGSNYWVDVLFEPAAAGGSALSISTTSLPGAVISTAYAATLTAMNGTPPYSWSIASGLPKGLVLDGRTGVISGTPTNTGSTSFSVEVVDSGSQTSTKALGITVSDGMTGGCGSPSSGGPAAIGMLGFALLVRRLRPRLRPRGRGST